MFQSDFKPLKLGWKINATGYFAQYNERLVKGAKPFMRFWILSIHYPNLKAIQIYGQKFSVSRNSITLNLTGRGILLACWSFSGERKRGGSRREVRRSDLLTIISIICVTSHSINIFLEKSNYNPIQSLMPVSIKPAGNWAKNCNHYKPIVSILHASFTQLVMKKN